MSDRRLTVGGGRLTVRRDARVDLGGGWYTFESCAGFARFAGEPDPDAVGALEEAIVDHLVAGGAGAGASVFPSTVIVAHNP